MQSSGSRRGALGAFFFIIAHYGGLASQGAREKAGSPVEKVVNLLKELKSGIEQDGEDEEKIYNKYACWCDTSMKLKANAIDKANIDLRSASQEILKLKGTVATLTMEIQELADKMEENKKGQADATAARTQENGEFMAEATEMKHALAAMQSAIAALKDGTSLLQSDAVQVQAVRRANAVRQVLQTMPAKVAVSEKQVALLTTFMRAGAHSKYAPQSMTIQGILTDMYSTFSGDLETATGAEAQSNRNYETFISSKQEELQALQAASKTREDQKADAEVKLADATALYDDTDSQKAADIEFFDATKKACLAKSEEWNLRKDMRAEEKEGISKALAILTSDESRELFASAIKPGVADVSFLQVGSRRATERALQPQLRAYDALRAEATRARSLRLAQLAVRVRSAKFGHFEEVIAAIDKMLKTLQEEDASDIAKRDQCKALYQETESTIKDLEWKVKKNNAKIEKLESIIAKKEALKTKTLDEIKLTEEQIKTMEEQRTAENAAFLAAKEEDENAIVLLDKAKAALSKYYEEVGTAMGPIEAGVKDVALVRKQEPEFKKSQWEAPEATFSGKGSRKGENKGIVSIMTYLIEDLHNEIEAAEKDEASAQLAYEEAHKAAEKLKAELEAKVVSLDTMIAERGEEKAEEHVKLQDNTALLDDEVSYRKQITPDCDWILRAFSERAARRSAEMSGLTAAKAHLAGAAAA